MVRRYADRAHYGMPCLACRGTGAHAIEVAANVCRKVIDAHVHDTLLLAALSAKPATLVMETPCPLCPQLVCVCRLCARALLRRLLQVVMN